LTQRSLAIGRNWRQVVAFLAAGVGLIAIYAWPEARRLPGVRTTAIQTSDRPVNTPPLRIVLMSDIHLGNTKMDEQRLRRIVALVNQQAPNLILIAGARTSHRN
jgi:predicted MPP superfamily phosphohydrolase